LDNEIGQVVSEYKGHHKSDIYHSSVKFSKDNSYILQASEDNRVVLYDLATKNEIMSLRGHSRPVVSIDVHPTEKGRLVSGSADGLVKIWGPLNKDNA
jgi:WD40 repeat protein